jgi:hypothetical protein
MTERLKDFIARHVFHPLQGMALGDWWSLLRRHRFAIDLRHSPRALVQTAVSASNSVGARLERQRFGRRVDATPVQAPLFVLGHYRSGTTHLHNLLARDDRLAYPTTFQVYYPRTFLTRKSAARMMAAVMPRTRPQDRVAVGVDEPQEDEFALCALTGRAVPVGWAFPRSADWYHRYLTLREAPEAEVAEWASAMASLVRKLAFAAAGRPLVLKSPGHTGRIRILLELFPDARFVHIRREPFVVFQSTRHTMRAVAPWFALQRPDFDGLDERIIRQYRESYDAYFEERALIPEGHLHEVSFEQLEADPIGLLRGLYEALRLPRFDHAEPTVRAYLQSLSGYRKNEFPELDEPLRGRLAREWGRCFEEWGYPA